MVDWTREFRERAIEINHKAIENRKCWDSLNLGYEWDIGHFHGAQRPDVDCFRSTSFGISPTEWHVDHSFLFLFLLSFMGFYVFLSECWLLSLLSHLQGVASDQLLQVDKEKTDILMYCTGGIRCDVYSTILR
ncbi:hypothetical protein Godav_017134 [Gossypium davidsonii]|uniref:Rhodanese domain-containing protein n=1 Tax=Gossypium davidsonii TaxID=34287 RepID=A0A7J8QSB4_GOSDV|nr:hypothetical protein [Gossypium davidsonii]